jgi:hypothetical protein
MGGARGAVDRNARFCVIDSMLALIDFVETSEQWSIAICDCARSRVMRA